MGRAYSRILVPIVLAVQFCRSAFIPGTLTFPICEMGQTAKSRVWHLQLQLTEALLLLTKAMIPALKWRHE